MFLVLAFTAQPGGPTLPNNLIVALINKQKHLSRGVIQCSHDPRTSGVDTLSLFQQKNTPYTGVPLQDWRGRLRSELESQGHYQRDSVIRSVALICQDLESRCNIAEEPLLREKEKSQQLEETVTDLNARLLFLESEATDTRFHLEGLEDEKLNLFDENERLSAKLNNLQADLDAASRNAAEMSHKHEGDIHAKDLELQSMTLSHEESLRTHCKQMEAQEETLRELRRDLQHISAQKAMLDNEHEALHIKFSTANQKLSDEVKNGRTQFEEIAQLRDRNTELELQLQSTQADLDTTTTRLCELQVGHQKLVHSSEQAYKDLESKYSTDMETAAAVVKETSETLNVQLQEALQYGHKAEEEHRDTRHELEQLQTSVSTLENRLQELADFCSEQEEELEELRALRKNVLAGLGLASQHPLPIRSTNRVQKDTSDLQNMRGPREHRRRKSAIQILDGAMDTARSTQGVTSTAMETIANASFASSDSQSSQNGPTPKRPKPRPSFKVPAIRTPYTQKPTLASRSTLDNTSPSKRSALRQLSPNRRHTTVGFAVSDDDVMHNNDCRLTRKRRGSLHGIHEADFDMDDFMAGTPMTPGNFATGTGRVPDDEDLTTTEL
jgi:myosin heavy subunit